HKALEELGIARERWLRRCAARREDADEKLLRAMLDEAVPRLAEALTHPDVGVRRSALDVLEMSGSLARPALPALTRALRDPDRFVRWSAVRTVGKFGPSAPPQTLPSLLQMLNDPDEGLRKAAADALERLRSQTEPRP
ncbi:MAG: HEAT repeat domain-containing protein, partial [Gemmataceae bacterium]